nr:uncharacterized protein LOC116153640 [Camelus dromedarius]
MAVVGNLPPRPQKEKRAGLHTNKEPNACSWWDGPQGELTAVVATQQSHAWSVLGPGGALGPAWRRTLEVGGPGRSLQADHLTGNHPLRAGASDSNVTMTSVSGRRRLATPCTQREGPSEGQLLGWVTGQSPTCSPKDAGVSRVPAAGPADTGDRVAAGPRPHTHTWLPRPRLRPEDPATRHRLLARRTHAQDPSSSTAGRGPRAP